jgi:hypothetical protein
MHGAKLTPQDSGNQMHLDQYGEDNIAKLSRQGDIAP